VTNAHTKYLRVLEEVRAMERYCFIFRDMILAVCMAYKLTRYDTTCSVSWTIIVTSVTQAVSRGGANGVETTREGSAWVALSINSLSTLCHSAYSVTCRRNAVRLWHVQLSSFLYR